MWKLFLKLWWLAALLAVIGAAGFTLYQRLAKTPMYESSATFTVATGDENSEATAFITTRPRRTSFPKHFLMYWRAVIFEAPFWTGWERSR